MDEAKQSFLDRVQENIAYGFSTYRDFIFGLFVGLVVAWFYHRFIGNYNLRKSYGLLLKGKDETIAAYRALVSEKMEKMDTPEYDKGFFKRLKKFFRKANL